MAPTEEEEIAKLRQERAALGTKASAQFADGVYDVDGAGRQGFVDSIPVGEDEEEEDDRANEARRAARVHEHTL